MKSFFDTLITELGIGIPNPIFGLALLGFWKRALSKRKGVYSLEHTYFQHRYTGLPAIHIILQICNSMDIVSGLLIYTYTQ